LPSESQNFTPISLVFSSKEGIRKFVAAQFTISLIALQYTQTRAGSSDTFGLREIDGERKPVELEIEIFKERPLPRFEVLPSDPSEP